MSDPELVLDILSSILIAVERIERRFQGIEAAVCPAGEAVAPDSLCYELHYSNQAATVSAN